MIDLTTIDLTRFRVREYNDGKHTLVTRAHNLSYDYRPGEHELRSIVVETETGRVISSGFPKFFNYGEDKATDRAFRNASSIWYAPKYDGSLIIVSPQEDGPAIVRTRGTYTVQGTPFESVLPLLSEWTKGKTIEEDRLGKVSFLFEYVGPENRIVLPYKESKIVYLGWIDHRTFDFTPWLECKSCQDLDALVSEIRASSLDEAGEGVVAYCVDQNDKTWMCKIKTEEYLALHRLRFDMTDKKLRALTAFHGFWTIKQARQFIEERIGLDFECVNEAVIQGVIDRENHALARRREFMVHCSKNKVLGQRAIAQAAKQFDNDLWAYLMHAEFAAQGVTPDFEKAEQALIAYAAGMTYRQCKALVGEIEAQKHNNA